MIAFTRFLAAVALVALLGAPVLAPAAAVADAEPCSDGSSSMCAVRTFFFHSDTSLTEEEGTHVAFVPYTFSFQWNGTPYRGFARDIPQDFTFAAEDSLTVTLYRYADRADSFTTVVEARAFKPGTAESMVLVDGAVFTSDVEAMHPEAAVSWPGQADAVRPGCGGHAFCPAVDAVADDETADVEGWNVLTVDFGQEVTVPAGWTIQVQVRTYVGEGHPEEPYLERLESPRTNPDAIPRPTFVVRHDTPDFPSNVAFRLVQG